MRRLKLFFHYLFNDRSTLAVALLQKLAFLFPDKLYLELMFRLKMKYPLNLKNPQTFNEKLQWLKLYDRKPEYTRMVDKYAVKEYVSGIIGREYVIPTLGVWDNFGQIDLSSLPEQFVLKTTHGGGGVGVVICKDKSHFDIADAKRKLNKSMSTDIYRILREWPYKNVRKRIIAEELIQNGDKELFDYKIFCFNGKACFLKIDFNRFICQRTNYYDVTGKLLPFGDVDCPRMPEIEFNMPSNLPEMISIAEKLSAGIPVLRVDLYNTEGKIYFGELTFFHGSGFSRIYPEEYDLIIGKHIEI